MTREQLIQAVRAIVIATTGLAAAQVIPAQDKGPRPTGLYATVRVQSMSRGFGHDARTYSDVEDDAGDIVVDIVGQRSATVVIAAYGDGAADALDLVQRAQRLLAVREDILDDLGIALTEIGSVVDVSALRGDVIEQQANLTLTVRYAVEYTDAVAPVETITATGAGDLSGMTLTVEA